MKKILFAALAATTLFAACSKDNTGTANAAGESVIMVNLPGSTTRSIEGQVPDQQVAPAITNAIVFLANSGTGAIVKYEAFSAAELTAKYKRIEAVPNAVNKVIVVANTPDDEFTDPSTLTTYDAVTKYAFTIAGQNVAALADDGVTASIRNKTLMGEGTPMSKTDPDPTNHVDHNYKEVTIALNSITARFEVGTVSAGKGIKNIELVGVWINNFNRNGAKRAIDIVFNAWDSAYWITDPSAADDSPTSVATAFDNVDVRDYNCELSYYNEGSDQVILDADTKVYAYHVFTGEVIPHLILLVKGEYDDTLIEGGGPTDYKYHDGNNRYFLGWLTYKNYDVVGGGRVQTIEHNSIYRVGVGAEGIVVDAEHITDYPETSFDLGIKCTITPWTRYNVTPSID